MDVILDFFINFFCLPFKNFTNINELFLIKIDFI